VFPPPFPMKVRVFLVFIKQKKKRKDKRSTNILVSFKQSEDTPTPPDILLMWAKTNKQKTTTKRREAHASRHSARCLMTAIFVWNRGGNAESCTRGDIAHRWVSCYDSTPSGAFFCSTMLVITLLPAEATFCGEKRRACLNSSTFRTF
jgi:hypothetical protein